MKAAIVTIGDEILIGQITDTNSAYIAKALDRIGISVYEMFSISDDRQHILNTLAFLQNRVQVVIITGGLGPTKDDVTKNTFCEYFDDHLVVNQEVLEHVIKLIEKALQRPASQLNKDQALVPSKCTVLHNEVGTAPGMCMKRADTLFISLPGVPYEMKHLLEERVIPMLVSEYKRPFIVHKTILTYGQGESLVAERIEQWENNLPPHIKLAYLPSPGRVRLRLTARGEDEAVLRKQVNAEADYLATIIGDIITGYDEGETIEVSVGMALKQKGKTLAVAESCTGGAIAQLITSVPGASAYFKGGAVTYATISKSAVLGVSPEVIDTYGVVSAEVAQAMAVKAREVFGADYAVATTGNAGPDKGDGDAEVGTVYIGFATPQRVWSDKYEMGRPREKVIARAAAKALETIYKEILKN